MSDDYNIAPIAGEDNIKILTVVLTEKYCDSEVPLYPIFEASIQGHLAIR